jgi:peptidoglycan/LPS O-acetylase OafA/YrhL
MSAMVKTARRYYRPELDVVRFLAFFLVFLAHTRPAFPDPRISAALKGLAPVLYSCFGAYKYGLSVFFTLSAFLICQLLLAERKTTGTVSAKKFYFRRILRIWPLYYLGLALGAAFAFIPGGNPGSAARLGWFVIFMGAWESATHGWLLNPMFSLWSVSVEEQFYLFAPLSVKYLSQKALYGFCALIVAGANGRIIYLVSAHASADRIWADAFVQFECFGAGILLCLLLRGKIPVLRGWQRLALLAAGWCALVFAGRELQSADAGCNPVLASMSVILELGLASVG